MSPATDEINVGRVEFVGEQEGPAETTLKDRLTVLFGQHPGVTKAYLVRAIVDGEGTVILGLVAEVVDERNIAEQVSAVFAAVFNSEAHLDVGFLSGKQHVAVSKVCGAFYDRSDDGASTDARR